MYTEPYNDFLLFAMKARLDLLEHYILKRENAAYRLAAETFAEVDTFVYTDPYIRIRILILPFVPRWTSSTPLCRMTAILAL